MNNIEKMIKYNKLIYGYKVDNDILKINDEIKKFMYDLSQEEFTSYALPNTTKTIFIEDVKNFFDNYLKLRDVLYLEQFELFKKLNHHRVNSLKELITLYNQLGNRVNPFDIPLIYEGIDNFYGLTEIEVPICEEDEFLEKMNLYFNRIVLSRNITPIVGVCYTHEITHTQLIGNRGIIKDFYNMELLPIFIELLYAYNNDPSLILFKTVLANRINNLLNSFDKIFNYYEKEKKNEKSKVDAMFCSKYIHSILQAFKLFNVYIRGAQELKKEIIEWIQQVFDGLRCLEDMLKYFEISYENSINLEMILSMKRV